MVLRKTWRSWKNVVTIFQKLEEHGRMFSSKYSLPPSSSVDVLCGNVNANKNIREQAQSATEREHIWNFAYRQNDE